VWNTCGMRMIHLTLEIHIPIPRGLHITHYCATTSGRRCSGHAPVRLLSAALRRGKDALAALRQVTELQTADPRTHHHKRQHGQPVASSPSAVVARAACERYHRCARGHRASRVPIAAPEPKPTARRHSTAHTERSHSHMHFNFNRIYARHDAYLWL